MNKTIQISTHLLLAAGLTTSLCVQADWYLGAGGGLSKNEVDASPGENPPPQVSSDMDDRDIAWQVFGGRQITDKLSIELGYLNLGETSTSVQIGNVSNVSAARETDGVTLALLGSYPISDSFQLLGRVGLYWWESDLTITSNSFGTQSQQRHSDDGTDLLVGVGLGYNWDNLGARLEYQRLEDLGDQRFDYDALMLSLTWAF